MAGENIIRSLTNDRLMTEPAETAKMLLRNMTNAESVMTWRLPRVHLVGAQREKIKKSATLSLFFCALFSVLRPD